MFKSMLYPTRQGGGRTRTSRLTRRFVVVIAVLATFGALLVGGTAVAAPAGATTSTAKKVVLVSPEAMTGATCYKGRTIAGKVYVPVVKGIKYEAYVNGKYGGALGMIATQPYGNRYYRAVDSSGNVVGMWRVSMFFNGGKKLVCSKVHAAAQHITLRVVRRSAGRVNFTVTTKPRVQWLPVSINLWNKKARAWRTVVFKNTVGDGIMHATMRLPAGEQILQAGVRNLNNVVAYTKLMIVKIK